MRKQIHSLYGLVIREEYWNVESTIDQTILYQ